MSGNVEHHGITDTVRRFKGLHTLIELRAHSDARFWSKVRESETGCWEWQGATLLGYGRFRPKEGSPLAHRVAFELTRGTIPAGLTLDHLCSVRRCVNPDHLEPVEAIVNVKRAAMRRTHCKRGHELVPDNLYFHRNGARLVRRCDTCFRGATAGYRRGRSSRTRPDNGKGLPARSPFQNASSQLLNRSVDPVEPEKTTFEVVPTSPDGTPWAIERITCEAVRTNDDGSVEFVDDADGISDPKLVAYFRHVHSVRRMGPTPPATDVQTLVVNIGSDTRLAQADIGAILETVNQTLRERGLK